MKDELLPGQFALKIPNLEIMDLFKKHIIAWFTDRSASSDRQELFDALWNEDTKALTSLISDLVIKDRRNRRAVVIEAKWTDSESRLEKECADALRQIEKNQYAEKIERAGFRRVERLGIAFFQKNAWSRAVINFIFLL